MTERDWFAGRTAVVTGAAVGIGRATAELLAELGARVIAIDRDAATLERAFAGGICVPWLGDLAAPDAADLADELWLAHGPIDLVVNNVGVGTQQTFVELDEAAFDEVFATNLRGPWFFTRRIVARLVDERRPGAIVFVSSVHDTFIRTQPHYSASKAAVAMLVKELAHELGPHDIRVNAVSPGSIVVPRTAPADDSSVPRVDRIPLGRRGRPADVARMVAVLLSEEWAGYVTGANVRVDGGLSLRSWSVEEKDEAAAAAARDGLLGRLRRRAGR